jgi:hypothetical protein
MLRMTKRRILRVFGIIERPAAWSLLLGGVVIFFGVLFNLIATGNAKWATLLVSADLIVSGLSSVQQAHDDDPRTDNDEETV